MEIKRIDETTVVPIGWALTGFATTLAVVIVGAFWVSAVDFRLMRIEEKLGIPNTASNGVAPIENAFAEDDKKHDDSKRLSKSLGHVQPRHVR